MEKTEINGNVIKLYKDGIMMQIETAGIEPERIVLSVKDIDRIQAWIKDKRLD